MTLFKDSIYFPHDYFIKLNSASPTKFDKDVFGDYLYEFGCTTRELHNRFPTILLRFSESFEQYLHARFLGNYSVFSSYASTSKTRTINAPCADFQVLIGLKMGFPYCLRCLTYAIGNAPYKPCFVGFPKSTLFQDKLEEAVYQTTFGLCNSIIAIRQPSSYLNSMELLATLIDYFKYAPSRLSAIGVQDFKSQDNVTLVFSASRKRTNTISIFCGSRLLLDYSVAYATHSMDYDAFVIRYKQKVNYYRGSLERELNNVG